MTKSRQIRQDILLSFEMASARTLKVGLLQFAIIGNTVTQLLFGANMIDTTLAYFAEQGTINLTILVLFIGLH